MTIAPLLCNYLKYEYRVYTPFGKPQPHINLPSNASYSVYALSNGHSSRLILESYILRCEPPLCVFYDAFLRYRVGLHAESGCDDGAARVAPPSIPTQWQAQVAAV